MIPFIREEPLHFDAKTALVLEATWVAHPKRHAHIDGRRHPDIADLGSLLFHV